jgi:WD40 repeat protein
LWSLSGPKPELLARITNNLVVAFGVAFSPDNKTLLVGWTDKPVLRYDLSRPESPLALPPLAGSMPPFAFSPDGKSLVTAGTSRRRVRRWTWPERTALPELRVLSGQANVFAFSPDGRWLATGLHDGQINFWDLANGATNQPVALHGHEDGVIGIEFVPRNGKMELVSVSSDQTLRVWDAEDSKRNEFVIHPGGSVKAVAFSPDLRYLATVVGEPVVATSDLSSKPYRLQLWDMASRLPVASNYFGGNGLGPQIAFSPDGTRLAVDDYGVLQFHDVPSLGLIATVGERDAVFDPIGQWLAYVVNTTIIKRASLDAPEIVLATQPDEIIRLKLSPNGRTLASSSVNGPLYLWDARDGHLKAKLSGHKGRAGGLDFSPDGETLVSADWNGLLGIWDVAGPRNLALFRSHNRLLSSAVFSPDGRTIATAGDDNTVRLWNLARRQEVMVLRGHTDGVMSVAFSRDGQWLASGSDDGTVRLWRAPSIEEIRAAEEEVSSAKLRRSSKSQSPSF